MAADIDQELSYVNDFIDCKTTELYRPNTNLPDLEDDDSYTFRTSGINMAERRPRLALQDEYEASDEDAPLITCTNEDPMFSTEHHCHSEQITQSNTKAKRQLTCACVVVLIFMIAEVIGGYFANSLAIMTDAAHMLSDFASFLISLFALWVATKPATTKMSFGYHRAEVIGAIVSVLIIWILTGVLVYMAIQRCIDQDYHINADIMIITAACGVAVNIFLGCVLHQTGHGHSHGGLGHSHGGQGHSHSEQGHSHDHSPEHQDLDTQGHIQSGQSSNVTESQNGGNYVNREDSGSNLLVINDCERTCIESSVVQPKKKKVPTATLR